LKLFHCFQSNLLMRQTRKLPIRRRQYSLHRLLTAIFVPLPSLKHFVYANSSVPFVLRLWNVFNMVFFYLLTTRTSAAYPPTGHDACMTEQLEHKQRAECEHRTKQKHLELNLCARKGNGHCKLCAPGSGAETRTRSAYVPCQYGERGGKA
jgi:hypothetical protein